VEEGADVRRRETSIAICSIAVGYAMAASVPGGRILFWATVIWNAISTIVVARTPKGDYAKALTCSGLSQQWHRPQR
jgi:hypothetical protein